MLKKFCKTIVIVSSSICFSLNLSNVVLAGTLSCTIDTTCVGGTVVMRMSGTTNAHAELPNQSNYANLLCCSGVAGLSNNCSGTHVVVAKLSSTTNAHVEQNDQSNYANEACLSVANGSSIALAYQDTNCTGYDTTLASLSATTNAHIGNSSAYTKKICASATAGSLTTDIVDSLGATVASPFIDMDPVSFSFVPETSTSVFGTSDQKIRVTNNSINPQWTLAIAATNGATAVWDDGGSNSYDFNDPTADTEDGPDLDAKGGQLSFSPAISVIVPQDGCSLTGITRGSSSAFNEGVVDSITLLSGGASAETACYWDLTAIGVSQAIPLEQPGANYTIDMTITITAI